MAHIYKPSSIYKHAYEKFGKVGVGFELSYPVIDKDRIFKLKIFDKDDKMILEKTITLRTSLSHPTESGYDFFWTTKVEVVPNDKYVKGININNRNGKAFILEI